MDRHIDDAVRDDAPANMLAWIDVHWEALAAVAWWGYVTVGRGLVVLDGWDGTMAVGYLAVADAAPGTPWPTSLYAAAQAYRPATDILFFIQQEAQGTLLGLRATACQRPPCATGQPQGTPRWVSAA